MAVREERKIGASQDRARADTQASPLGFDSSAVPMLFYVDQNAITLGLT
jgi:hypothetical protein